MTLTTVHGRMITDASVTADDLASVAADLQAIVNKLQLLPSGTGAVSQLLGDRLRRSVLLTDFGATLDGTTDNRAALETAATAAVALKTPLVIPTRQMVTTVAAVLDPAVEISGPGDPRTLTANGHFATWERAIVRSLSPAQFPYSAPTFGDAATYDGTGGLRVYHADMWHSKQYGQTGSGVITRSLATPAMVEVTPNSQYYLNWAATSFAPSAATNINITAMTAASSSPVTVTTATAHGLSTGDWTSIRGNVYTGGNGSLDAVLPNNGSYQVTVTGATTFTIAIAADAGYSAYTAFGQITNDPDATGYAHVYDGVGIGNVSDYERNWLRTGTAGHELHQRVPVGRFKDGSVTVRLRARCNSGNTAFYVRLFQDFGSSGSPTTTTSTTLPGVTLTSSVKDHVMAVQLPSIAAATYGTGHNTAYLQVSLVSAAPTVSHNIDIFSFAVHEGVTAPANPHRPPLEELPLLRQFYQGCRVGVLQTTASGSYYGVSHSFDPPMLGTPTVTRVSDVVLTGFATPTVSNNRTKNGFTAVAQASSVAANHWSSIFECEYNIPT
jgi:hypothetical protein